jgi:preprotein translocase subunit SecB
MLHYLRRSVFSYNDKSSLFTKIEQKQLAGKPEVMAQINSLGQRLRDNIFESVLEIKVKASVNDVEVYTAEFQYATVVAIDDADSYSPDEQQYITTVKVGYLAFPFARRYLFDMTRDSGSTPISLDPIDFDKMYHESRERAAAEGSAESTKH